MIHFHFLHLKKITWWRQIAAGLIILAFWGVLFGYLQPAAAGPMKGAAPSMSVVINEVAWMGNQSDPNAQWIELYNPGNSDVNLTGWKIILKSPGKPDLSIALSPNNLNENILSSGEYFLLEQSEPATSVKADLLSNNLVLDKAGMSLELWDYKDINNGILIDTANGNGGPWPYGDAATHCTMERVPDQPDTDNAWRTNDNTTINGTDGAGNPICGTPRSKNSTLPFPSALTPFPTLSLVINEVAWMGTQSDPDAQWIELYNPGGSPITLANWILRTGTGTFNINLSGKIDPGGYFLLERSGHIAISDPNIPPNQIYDSTLSLSLQGEPLQLIAPDGSVVDTADKQAYSQAVPWPAGDAASHCTMERAGAALADIPSSWITNAHQGNLAHDSGGNLICGTPNNVNWAYSVTPTATLTLIPSRTPTRTITPTPTPSLIPTVTRTPKKSPTPTRDPNIPPPSSVVINEFLVLPRFDWNGDGKVDSGDQFIEIINLSNQPISLSGWRLDIQPLHPLTYRIGNVTIQAGARLAFFNSQTGIYLSSGGGTVRLLKAFGQISDAFTYDLISETDKTWCRLPDGSNTWVFGCTPTVAEANHLDPNTLFGASRESEFCHSNRLPVGVQISECDSPGLSAWDSSLWTTQPAYPRFFDSGFNVYILD